MINIFVVNDYLCVKTIFKIKSYINKKGNSSRCYKIIQPNPTIIKTKNISY